MDQHPSTLEESKTKIGKESNEFLNSLKIKAKDNYQNMLTLLREDYSGKNRLNFEDCKRLTK